MSTQQEKKSIVSMGSINSDMILPVDHIVVPGETLYSGEPKTNAGGKGANQACAASRAGGRTFFAGRIGPDGGQLLEALQAQGVDCSYVGRGKRSSGLALIQVSSSGENAIVLYPGENFGFTHDFIDGVLADFGEGDLLLLQNEVNLMEYIIQAGAERGMHIILNPAPCTDAVGTYPLHAVDTLVVNEIEASMLAASDTEEPKKLIREVKAVSGSAAVILTLGSRGAYCLEGEQLRYVPAKRVKAVDTTSAGDTFIGFYAGAKLRGYSVPDALEKAAGAAAVCVTRPGAIASIPTWDEVE